MVWGAISFAILAGWGISPGVGASIGEEKAIPRHLQPGDELAMSPKELVDFGERLFKAQWTVQDGAGRPKANGMGKPLVDPDSPLEFPRNFNRISGPDANSCTGCHNLPRAGGHGDIVANVFVLGQRFDFVTFDKETDPEPVEGAVDESGTPVTLQSVSNFRSTIGMFGSGFIEMLARQMTSDLQRIRDDLAPGQTQVLTSKGVSFGTLSRRDDGRWDVSQVEGIPEHSLTTDGPDDPPSLIVRPFHQSGTVVSLRQFSNNAFVQHHGMQSVERFGQGEDADGDGVANELTVPDMTAVTLFQAALPVPGRVIPNDPEIEEAILLGEKRFQEVGCANCHRPDLTLDQQAWHFREPNPYNPPGNLQVDDAPSLSVDLTDPALPKPRLEAGPDSVVRVPAYTDLRLHDITSGPNDPNREPLNMNEPIGSDAFFEGNRRFMTSKLWGVSSRASYFHHGQYTTLREATLAHSGEALATRQAFEQLSEHERNCVIEFLKSLRILPPGTEARVVDEHYAPKEWSRQSSLRIAQSADGLIIERIGQADSGTYQLERCVTLVDPDWTTVGTPQETDRFQIPTQGTQGFFRIREVSK